MNSTTEEVRGRLGVGKLDNAVANIYADPYTQGALIILRNADGYLVHGKGLVRPRWLVKLRGLHCVSATWLRVSQSSGDRSVALLGTAFGALYSLSLDRKYEKDDALTLLWNAPNSDKIDGIRIELVAGKYVATVATTAALYLFSDAPNLGDLFVEERLNVVSRVEGTLPAASTTGPSTPPASFDNEDLPLPSELHFMTGSTGVASRRFVWAGPSGVTHAQLSVRRRRVAEPSETEDDHVLRTDKSSRSAVTTTVIDRETILWKTLKETSASAVPLACNLSTFHVLILYPDSVYAFNHISGQLTERIAVWNPGAQLNASSSSASVSLEGSRRFLDNAGLSGGNRDEKSGTGHLLSSPASGLIRNVSVDALWIYSADGEFARLTVTPEEQTEAWKAAQAVGRFDLAMALAPLVSRTMPDKTALFQTRETVLEAQADHAASQGDWDVAGPLYAKTNRPLESVVLQIVESFSTRKSGTTILSKAGGNLRALGVGTRLRTLKHLITYLVHKLHRIDSAKPMQRAIVATMLVQLYSSQLAFETDQVRREEVRKDFRNFLADRHQDLETETALGMLTRNGCHEEAWNLALLSGDIFSACEMSSRRGQFEKSLSLLNNSRVTKDADIMSQLIGRLTNNTAPQAPKDFLAAIGRSLRKDSHYMDHLSVIQGLARVARNTKDEEKAREAYQATVSYLTDLLRDWWGEPDLEDGNDKIRSDVAKQRDWYNLVSFLFALHAEFGEEAEAQRSYESLIVPYVSRDMPHAVTDTLSAILRCASIAGFRKLCVHLYQALGFLDMAVSLAIEIDNNLAESLVSQLVSSEIPVSKLRHLWCMVARDSSDPVGTVERSKGVLHIEDVLNDMEPFEAPTERVKNAVANSLEEHKRLANSAKSEAVSALEVTSYLRKDLETAQDWRQRAQSGKAKHSSVTFSCGHRVRGRELPGSGMRECELCGEKAIESLDVPFESGLSLPTSMQ